MAPKKKPKRSAATEDAVEKSTAEISAKRSAPATTGQHLERLFQEACANASPSQQRLLEEVNTLGGYPKRYKNPADKAEAASNALAKKLDKHKNAVPPQLNSIWRP